MEKNKRKFIIKVILIFLVALVSFNFTYADSGWDTSYDSGGSSSWDSSSSSYDWESSSSIGDSYSRSNSGSTSWQSIVMSFVVFITIVVVLIYLGSKPSNGKNIDQNYSDIDEEKLKTLLPDINLFELKEIVLKKFLEVQNAWMEFDYDKLRELCTDELFNAYKAQLEVLKIKNGKNLMSDFSSIILKITDVKESNGIITVVAYLKISFFDYVINTLTNKVTRGTDKMKITNNYLLTFIVAKDNIKQADKCPNCGADIESTTAGVCKYCGSYIVHEAKDFVLSKKTNINK